MEPGPLIGKGLTAEVFAWGEGQVVKLFFDWVPEEKVEREFFVARRLRGRGYPTPAAIERVKIEGRFGVVMERVENRSMVAVVQKQPWKFLWAARMLGKLHAQLHAEEAPEELRTQRAQIERWIELAADLPEAGKQAARDSLARLPTGTKLCHGDFHPDNILMTSKGPVVIDWLGASRGHPLGDVARTAHLIKHADLPESAPWHLKTMLTLSRKLLLHEYLRSYFRKRPGNCQELEIWEPAQKAAVSAWRCARMM